MVLTLATLVFQLNSERLLKNYRKPEIHYCLLYATIVTPRPESFLMSLYLYYPCQILRPELVMVAHAGLVHSVRTRPPIAQTFLMTALNAQLMKVTSNLAKELIII